MHGPTQTIEARAASEHRTSVSTTIGMAADLPSHGAGRRATAAICGCAGHPPGSFPPPPSPPLRARLHPRQTQHYTKFTLCHAPQVLEELLSRRDLTEEQTASALAVRLGPCVCSPRRLCRRGRLTQRFIGPQELLSSGNQLQMAAFLIALRAKVRCIGRVVHHARTAMVPAV